MQSQSEPSPIRQIEQENGACEFSVSWLAVLWRFLAQLKSLLEDWVMYSPVQQRFEFDLSLIEWMSGFLSLRHLNLKTSLGSWGNQYIADACR